MPWLAAVACRPARQRPNAGSTVMVAGADTCGAVARAAARPSVVRMGMASSVLPLQDHLRRSPAAEPEARPADGGPGD
ncbi:hypothetical protein G6F59_016992 [Rhizopus arrhizus]|nr:hypothetical protein G6F59_016992 [Rhizopus arrhizus]